MIPKKLAKLAGRRLAYTLFLLGTEDVLSILFGSSSQKAIVPPGGYS